ncbi:MAG: OprO/OprP family phosphate-selective porin, partial [Bacteroidales bacterium]|nr:OprO/OprP family phosphate-selective porin [Bacteroidales bacterium]
LLTHVIVAQENNISFHELQQKTETIEDEIIKLKKLKVSGYIQAQYQYGEKDATLGVGTSNETDESFNRIGIRRGRIKFTYEEGIASGVFQIDFTEKGIGFKDAYLNIKDPWMKTNQLRAGIFDRPFGFEISHSSSRRESPERSTVFQTLFPQERDLGAMLVLQAPKSSPLNILKLEAGFFAGNGIKQETDNRKDFIGHLSMNKTIGNNISFGAGISYYNGGVYQGTENVYKMQDKEFVVNNDASNKGEFAKREYFGLDAQFSIITAWGQTQLRGEYLFGQQPGAVNSSKSPNASELPEYDTYLRDFSGWYVVFVQDIGTLPFSAVLKYDSYDPNTKVSKDEIGLKGTTKTDLFQNTLGFGGIWKINNNLRLQAYYEINKNEKSANVEGMNEDLENNVFTMRLQYKF